MEEGEEEKGRGGARSTMMYLNACVCVLVRACMC